MVIPEEWWTRGHMRVVSMGRLRLATVGEGNPPLPEFVNNHILTINLPWHRNKTWVHLPDETLVLVRQDVNSTKQNSEGHEVG